MVVDVRSSSAAGPNKVCYKILLISMTINSANFVKIDGTPGTLWLFPPPLFGSPFPSGLFITHIHLRPGVAHQPLQLRDL